MFNWWFYTLIFELVVSVRKTLYFVWCFMLFHKYLNEWDVRCGWSNGSFSFLSSWRALSADAGSFHFKRRWHGRMGVLWYVQHTHTVYPTICSSDRNENPDRYRLSIIVWSRQRDWCLGGTNERVFRYDIFKLHWGVIFELRTGFNSMIMIINLRSTKAVQMSFII